MNRLDVLQSHDQPMKKDKKKEAGTEGRGKIEKRREGGGESKQYRGSS